MQCVDILQPEPFRVVQRKQETETAFTVSLQPEKKRDLSFLPGQFNMLYVYGIGEVAISFSGNPGIRQEYVHTIKTVGSVTNALEKIEEGGFIGVRGPFGKSWPIEKLKNKDIVIMAGGIGLAPLRPLIYHLHQNRGDYGNIAILYGARNPEDILYGGELEKWHEWFDGNFLITVDFAEVTWAGHVGVVTSLIPEIPFDLENSVALLCGPEVMLRFSVRDLFEQKMSPSNIYVSMERNMKCAIGHCGRCQYMQNFLCKDGPVFSYDRVAPFFNKKEV